MTPNHDTFLACTLIILSIFISSICIFWLLAILHDLLTLTFQ